MSTCRICAFTARGSSFRSTRHGYECRSAIQCLNRLMAREFAAQSLIKRIRHVGAQMANACFNLAQRAVIDHSDRRILDELRRDWDAAVGGAK